MMSHNNYFTYDMNTTLRDAVCDEEAFGGMLPIIRYLINRGADMQAENSLGKSALSIAREHKLTEVVEYFESLIEPEDQLIGKRARPGIDYSIRDFINNYRPEWKVELAKSQRPKEFYQNWWIVTTDVIDPSGNPIIVYLKHDRGCYFITDEEQHRVKPLPFMAVDSDKECIKEINKIIEFYIG